MSSDSREARKLESWGPQAKVHEVRVMRTSVLVAKRLGIAVSEASQRLMDETQGRHRYLLFRELGRSAHAVVYSAIDQLLAREVALKIHLIPPNDVDKWNVFREARTQVLFEHDNVVRLLDAGHCEGQYYWVTELCDEDLASWSQGKPWSVVLRRIIEAGRGLEAVHAAGIVHSDIKPHNIMVRGGVAKLGDFGMSGAAHESVAIGGTAGYIAPELVLASVRSPAADVFSLACTAWACVFGQLPYALPPDDVKDEAALVFFLERARAGVLLEPPAGDVPARIVELISRGLVPNPRMRPHLNEWLAELEWCVSVRRGEMRRYATMAAGVVVSVLAGVGLHAWAIGAGGEVEPEPAPLTITDTESEFGQSEFEPEQSLTDLGESSAWEEYADESNAGWPTPERLLEHARQLVEEAEETSSIEKAELASYVLGRVKLTHDATLTEEIEALSARAKTVLRQCDSPPCRRD